MQASQAHYHILTARTYRDTHECATLASISKATVLETEGSVGETEGWIQVRRVCMWVSVNQLLCRPE